MIQFLEKIQELTINDMKYKTDIQLYASLCEEFGELSREIKIEEKVYGNNYKKLDEGVKGETVDVYICALSLAIMLEYKHKNCLWNSALACAFLNFKTQITKDNVWDIFERLANHIGKALNHLDYSSLTVCATCIQLFKLRGGTEEEFINMVIAKLNKWEKSY